MRTHSNGWNGWNVWTTSNRTKCECKFRTQTRTQYECTFTYLENLLTMLVDVGTQWMRIELVMMLHMHMLNAIYCLVGAHSMAKLCETRRRCTAGALYWCERHANDCRYAVSTCVCLWAGGHVVSNYIVLKWHNHYISGTNETCT